MELVAVLSGGVISELVVDAAAHVEALVGRLVGMAAGSGASSAGEGVLSVCEIAVGLSPKSYPRGYATPKAALGDEL